MNKFVKIILGALLAYAAMPGLAHAQTDFFLGAPTQVRPNSQFEIEFYAKISDAVNAFQGKVILDPSRVKVISIDSSNSAIKYWISGPSYDGHGGINFAGIIPGGITPAISNWLNIFKITVQVSDGPPVTFSLADPLVYQNQPEPTIDQVFVHPLTLGISSSAPLSATPVPSVQVPAVYVKLVSDPHLNGGAYTAVFNVQNVPAGADVVSISERFLGFPSSWFDVSASSSYQLHDQTGFSVVELRVRDASGKYHTYTVIPWRLYVVWAIIALLIVAAAIRITGVLNQPDLLLCTS